MVKPAFENIAVEVWVHDHTLGSARRNLCVFHEAPGSGGQFLEAIRELNDAAFPATRTLTFAPCSRKRPITKLQLRLVPESSELRVLSVRCEESVATVIMTQVGLPLLINAFNSWISGREDFGVAPHHSTLKSSELGELDRESAELWFWGPRYLGP